MDEKEQEIVKYGIAQGKSPVEVKNALAAYRAQTGYKAKVEDVEKGYSLKEAWGDVKETGKEVLQGWDTAGQRINDRAQVFNPDQSYAENATRNFIGTGAELFRGIGNTIGSVFKGGAKLASTQSFENTASEQIKEIGTDVLQNEKVNALIEQYQSLPPDKKQSADDILGFLNGLTAMVGAKEAVDIVKNTVKGGANMVTNAAKGVVSYADDAARGATQSVAGAVGPTTKGVAQVGKELLVDRPVRAFQHAKSSVDDAALRAQRIQSASPSVRQAITSNVDDRAINTITQADSPSLKAYSEMLDIADNPSQTLRQSARPEIVAGKAAEAQYKIIEAQRKSVGQQIGTAVDKLSKSGDVNVLPAQKTMREVLKQNGVLVASDGTMKFTGKFTPNERSAIQKLYSLATEGGERLTPRQIYDMDQLFSKLQREARFENVGSIMVNTPDGDASLYKVFRDIYSKNLDEIAPEIRDLNRQYRTYRSLQDNIEDSIVKQGNFDVRADPAEFAQTNLRRIMSDAQSAAAYRDILAQMDEVARANGYAGARPDDLIEFATYLREVYPDTVPRTSLPGSIKTAVTPSGILDKAIEAGAPNLKDAQKALREMIEEALAKMDASEGLSTGKTPLPVQGTVQAKSPTRGVSNAQTSPATVPQPSKASTPLSTATRQGAQKSSSLVKNTKLTVAEQTQNNIVLALIDEGDKALANKIAKISMEGAKSADDIASRIRKELGDEVLKNTDVAPHLKSAEMMFDFQKSTMQKVKDAILPGDTPNKEGGFVSIGKKTNGTTWTVTYVKNGKKTTMKGMSTENMQDWTQYLDSKGIKYKRSSA